MNPYDPCVANQTVNGLQQSIIFNVGGCKLSHNYTKVNTSLTIVLHDQYKNIFEDGSGTIQVNCGKFHR